MARMIRDRSFWMGLSGVVVGCLLTEVVRTGPLEDVRADTPSTPATSIQPDGTSEGASHAQARTAPDRYIPFQAYLTDSEGRPVADTTYSIEFKLYESAEGGEAVWRETHNAVPVAKGMVNVLLGSKNPDNFGDLTFDEAKYVGICVDCTLDTGVELVPRQQIIPAIHAADSDRAGQLVIPGTFEPAVVVDGVGNVGIGTAEPLTKLHVKNDDGLAWIVVERGNTASRAQCVMRGAGAQWEVGLAGGGHYGAPENFGIEDGSHGVRLVIDLSGNVGIGRTNPSARLDVNGTTRTTALEVTNPVGSGLVPPGAILMWSGSTSNIPAGWALCDGGNGTPDLRMRFVVGAGSAYAVGDTGGANAVALTIDTMPSHDHGGGNHRHGMKLYTNNQAWADRISQGGWEDVGGVGNTYYSGDIVSPQGGGAAHENRPPYYALAYIMKL